ncbi:SPATS2-like protein [Ambystoma mexicanum]|uniref:SPATS2-like protein n=1 Tax=Ambystoma mexicanum TaxID=8296 RepID=UPI0037E753FF
MAETNYQGNMKEKISAVRSIAHNKSNNEIVLVLQQFDNNVEKAIQAFVDGSAAEVLREWNMPGKKKVNKRKRTKCKAQAGDKAEGNNEPTEGPQGVCGNHLNGLDKGNLSSDSATESTDPKLPKDNVIAPDSDPSKAPADESLQIHPGITEEALPECNGLPKGSYPHPTNGVQRTEQPTSSAQQKGNRNRTKKTAAVMKLHPSPEDPELVMDEANKKRGTNVEKSVKDLQRCTVSLARYRLMIKEEMDGSVKKIKATFAELLNSIIDREVALMTEVDKVKQEAMDILTARQKKAEGLKRMTDLASQMSDAQLSELRADIKHFVSERKYDEELGRSARFSCDIDHLKSQILHCGEISHPKNSYSLREVGSSAPPSPEDLTALVGNRILSRQNGPATLRVPERKINMNYTKVSPGDPAENSTFSSSSMKQNGPSNQKRRYNPRSQGIRNNGPAAHPHYEMNVNAKSSSGPEDQMPPYNGVRNKSKGTTRTEDPHPAQGTGKSQPPPMPSRGKHPELDPRFIHGNINSVSHCHLNPGNMEILADATGRSVRTVTLVA